MGIVIHASGIYVCNFLVKTALAQANLANLCQQVFKVILSQKLAILHALAVEHIATDGKVSQHRRSPLAKLGSRLLLTL